MNTGFNWLDYIVLIGYLFAILGVATLFVKEQKTLKDFFMASRNMPWMAVGLSILATLLSAISITGAPAEFFENGHVMFGLWWIASILVTFFVVKFFVATFVKLELTSAYEYLEKRFCLAVRLVASFLFMMIRGMYIGVVIYASAIILMPALGGKVDMIWLIIGVGVFSAAFAVLGGMKAVIWTDVIQIVVVYIGIIWICFTAFGRIDGGFSEVVKITFEQGKDFSYLSNPKYWSFDFFEKTTFFGLLIGFFFNDMAQKGSDQLTVQRYLTTGSVKASAKALWVNVIGSIVIGLILTGVAMGLFAFYHVYPDAIDIESVGSNGILPYFIVTQMPHGLAGLFIAAIIAAILSTVDSGMNCLATVTMTDFQIRLGKKQYTDDQNVWWARFWTILWGLITTGLAVFIYVSSTENIMRLSTKVLGLFSGPLLGIFLLGLLVPRANSKGVIVGAVIGSVVTFWTNYGWVKIVDGQPIHVSFVWPIVFGVLATCSVGYLVSIFTTPPSERQTAGLTYWSQNENIIE